MKQKRDLLPIMTWPNSSLTGKEAYSVGYWQWTAELKYIIQSGKSRKIKSPKEKKSHVTWNGELRPVQVAKALRLEGWFCTTSPCPKTWNIDLRITYTQFKNALQRSLEKWKLLMWIKCSPLSRKIVLVRHLTYVQSKHHGLFDCDLLCSKIPSSIEGLHLMQRQSICCESLWCLQYRFKKIMINKQAFSQRMVLRTTWDLKPHWTHKTGFGAATAIKSWRVGTKWC